MSEADSIIDRLADQISWYDRKSLTAQRTFKRIKVIEIVATALIPFLAALNLKETAWATGGLRVLVTIFEGLLHLNQHQQNWTTYRSTCEALKHEKYVYLGKAGPYATAIDHHVLLAERIESLVSQKNAKWVSSQQQESKPKDTQSRI